MEDYDHQLPSLVVGAIFENKAELKKACQKEATRGNFEYAIIKSDRTRLTIKCSGNACPWHMHASRAGNTDDGIFEVKSVAM